MLAKRFFYVCAGLLCLALAYHLGARSAGAQVGSMVSGFSGGTDSNSHCRGTFYVMTDNGDVYGRTMVGGLCGSSAGTLSYIGNFWGGDPVPAQRESFGAMKSRYRARGAAQPSPQGR